MNNPLNTPVFNDVGACKQPPSFHPSKIFTQTAHKKYPAHVEMGQVGWHTKQEVVQRIMIVRGL
eukprot:200775-Chlamydomonas_euryale.AAC.8